MIDYRQRTKPWYGTGRWKRIRKQQIAAYPLCVYCKKRGIVTEATVADHIVPHKGDAHLFWHGNLQSLCKQCHDSDKAREEGGKVIVQIGTDGWPIA